MISILLFYAWFHIISSFDLSQCLTGVTTADFDPPRIWTGGPNLPADMDSPFADLDSPSKISFWQRLYHIWYLILYGSFLSTFFSFTTQHSSVKIKINSHFAPILTHLASRAVYARIKCEETTAFELLKLLQFSRRDQNAWDLRKFCAYKRDNAVWNYFRTHFQDNLVPSFGLFGVFWENLPLHLRWIPERKHNRWQAPDPRF